MTLFDHEGKQIIKRHYSRVFLARLKKKSFCEQEELRELDNIRRDFQSSHSPGNRQGYASEDDPDDTLEEEEEEEEKRKEEEKVQEEQKDVKETEGQATASDQQ
jgi:hypothetical protein